MPERFPACYCSNHCFNLTVSVESFRQRTHRPIICRVGIGRTIENCLSQLSFTGCRQSVIWLRVNHWMISNNTLNGSVVRPWSGSTWRYKRFSTPRPGQSTLARKDGYEMEKAQKLDQSQFKFDSSSFLYLECKLYLSLKYISYVCLYRLGNMSATVTVQEHLLILNSDSVRELASISEGWR